MTILRISQGDLSPKLNALKFTWFRLPYVSESHPMTWYHNPNFIRRVVFRMNLVHH